MLGVTGLTAVGWRCWPGADCRRVRPWHTRATGTCPLLHRLARDGWLCVSAAVCRYGYYGPRDRDHEMPSTPLAYARPDAPPFLVVHR